MPLKASLRPVVPSDALDEGRTELPLACQPSVDALHDLLEANHAQEL